MARRDVKKPLPPIDPAVVQTLAQEFAAWRINGCPGYGFHEHFKAKVERAARPFGRSYGELWALVHAVAEPLYLACN